MIKNTLFVSLLLWSFFTYSQVVINELDPDTNSTDVKEFIELKSNLPNFSLNGYVVVFFNAGSTSPYSGTSSYYAIDLDGLITDGNGIVLLGNLQVSPSASIIIPQNTIQNGPDAVAIYLGNASDFPINTLATATNLIDGLAYSNSSSTSPTALMSILGETVCYNENANGLASTQSIQRKSDGTYEVKAPTPRANNDGSGIIYNGIAVTYTSSSITEGQNFSITFTTDTPVLSPLNFSISLNYGSFSATDFSGNLNITIPVGATSASTTIQILNDGANEGDENMRITLGVVPSDYVILNNNILIRIHDINFIVRPWGTPINATHGLCSSTVPLGYYSSLEGKSGLALRQAIQDIISNPNVVRVQNYGDAYTVLKDADQNPENSGQVWMLYDEQSISKIDYQTDNSIIGKWNREHVYCQSRLGIPSSFIPNSISDGINIWRLTTGLNDIEASHDDNHHLRAVGGQENSSRSNRNYGVDYNGPSGSLGSWRGDVARSVFYMALRYNGLNVDNGNPSDTPAGHIGDLATLLTWNTADTSDDYEMNRNNVVYTWQTNRNPFIDYPQLADYIWGTRIGQTWSFALSTDNFDDLNVSIYPNPSQNQITISGLNQESTIEIFDLSGMKLKTATFNGTILLELNLSSGMYLAKISSDNKTTTKKLIVN
jgi:endonuclease I